MCRENLRGKSTVGIGIRKCGEVGSAIDRRIRGGKSQMRKWPIAMAFSLMPLSDGLVSLEFEVDDHEALRQTIRAMYGNVQQQPAGPWIDKVSFGGQEFVYQDEWDEPCLIAHTPKGSEILKELHGKLTRGD
jgi:hypothetical protein